MRLLNYQAIRRAGFGREVAGSVWMIVVIVVGLVVSISRPVSSI